MLTAKHKLRLNPNEISTKEVLYTCGCGKKYKHMSSLCSHRNTCMYTNVTDIMPQTGNDTDTVQIVGIMETLIKENQDFKKLMIEHEPIWDIFFINFKI